MFTDTHCHMFKEYYENFENIVENMQKNKINRVFNNGVDGPTNREILGYLKQYEFMYGAIGIHPEYVNGYTQEDLNFVEEHLNDDKVIAIGEIGLDYHYGKEDKDKQIELFEYQLALAEKYNKPVIVHSRDATQDTIECMKKYKVRGVMHSFSGSYETAQIYLKMGLLLGINGVITFKNCNLKDVYDKIDLSNIVLETDSPYLTPVPFRGEKNDPSHVLDIAKYVADLKGVSLEELSKITNDNIKRCFDI